jgi:hypothetical protein
MRSCRRVFAGRARRAKKNLPAGGRHATALAAVLDRWPHDNADPYLGPHWLPTD